MPSSFVTTGDLANAAYVTDPKLYGECAAKVHQNVVWRAQHAGAK